MGDQEPAVDHALPVMDYVTADDATGMPDATKLVGSEETAMDPPPQAVAVAVAVAVDYDAADATGLPDGNKFTGDEEPSIDQAPPSICYDTVDATDIPDANTYVGDQESTLNQAAPVTDYETADATGMPDVNQFTSTEHHADENGNVAIGDNREHEQEQFEELPAISTEEDRLWIIVKANPAEFNAWTSLIQETEKVAEDNLSKICRVYDAFLREFPLCYGYWKKYADHEARLGTVDKIVEVYERAVQAVTYSVDIWMHYCVFAMSTYEDPDTIRRLFERGLSYVGTDYLSYPLWDKYIEFEYSQQDWSRLAQIYTRILQIPIQQLDRYYNSFKELVASRPLAELRTIEENDAAAAAVAAAAAAAMEAGREGSEGNTDGGEEAPKPEVASLSEADELEKYLAVREVMYKKAKELDAKIRDFETAIRRPYFHVKALDDMQLGNWHRYLDFIEKGNDFDRIVKLYERCLIACANYSEYWIRYVQCMEAAGSMEVANDALARATQIFVKRQPEIHIFAARFKEQVGDISGARSEYQFLNAELAPGLLEAIIKHSNLEHRLGNIEAAISIFETATATEKAKEESQSLPLLFIQYSRFLQLVAGNTDRAREVLIGALELLPLSKPLLEVAIHLESIRPGPKQIEYLDSAVEKMMSPKSDASQGLSAADREEISSIFLEFVDLFGDIHAIKKADVRHRQLFPPHKSSAVSKKRPSQENIASDRVKAAKPYLAVSSAVSPAQSGMTAYPNGQSQWGAGYAQQSQGWQQPPPQQAPQLQPQQWNPGYGQQAGYSAYGGYPNYGHPQQQPTPAQQPGYGSYGQGYPPQAFPQQNYGQPAPAYAPAQQQAPPAPQGYYPGYY